MKKLFLLLIAMATGVMVSCTPADPEQLSLVAPTQQQLLLSKVVAIGNSITAGYQSGGLVVDGQTNTYGTIIAQQMGQGGSFVQPLLASPGFGSANLTTGEAFGPLKFVNGSIVGGDPIPGGVGGISGLLVQGGNALLPRPYDNLGVPGADLNDVLNTTSDAANPFFTLVLRNPNFGNTTQLQQAILLQPSLIYLWIGNNDVLGAALGGTTVGTITAQSDFDARLDAIVNRLQDETRARIVIINIPDVTSIPYVNVLNNVATSNLVDLGAGPQPVVFNFDGEPVNFSGDPANPLYIPLLTEETGVEYTLLPFLSQYQATGLGVPDSAALTTILPVQLHPLIPTIIGGLQAFGINPSGVAIPSNLTLTTTEVTTIRSAVTGFNAKIASTAASRGLVPVDAFGKFNDLVNAGPVGIDGVSAFFVLADQNRTVFSLDGFHPSNAGHAYLAREIIKAMNTAFGLAIPTPNPSDYAGQFSSGSGPLKTIQPGVIEAAAQMYIKQRAE